MKSQDENSTQQGGHQNKNERIKMVFSPKIGPRGNFTPSFGFALPALSCSYSLLQVFWIDTEFHEMVSQFIQFPTTLKLGMK
jgi:hypothetical protein